MEVPPDEPFSRRLRVSAAGLLVVMQSFSLTPKKFGDRTAQEPESAEYVPAELLETPEKRPQNVATTPEVDEFQQALADVALRRARASEPEKRKKASEDAATPSPANNTDAVEVVEEPMPDDVTSLQAALRVARQQLRETDERGKALTVINDGLRVRPPPFCLGLQPIRWAAALLNVALRCCRSKPNGCKNR